MFEMFGNTIFRAAAFNMATSAHGPTEIRPGHRPLRKYTVALGKTMHKMT
jgi:hypothetical protein